MFISLSEIPFPKFSNKYDTDLVAEPRFEITAARRIRNTTCNQRKGEEATWENGAGATY